MYFDQQLFFVSEINWLFSSLNGGNFLLLLLSGIFTIEQLQRCLAEIAILLRLVLTEDKVLNSFLLVSHWS